MSRFVIFFSLFISDHWSGTQIFLNFFVECSVEICFCEWLEFSLANDKTHLICFMDNKKPTKTLSQQKKTVLCFNLYVLCANSNCVCSLISWQVRCPVEHFACKKRTATQQKKNGQAVRSTDNSSWNGFESIAPFIIHIGYCMLFIATLRKKKQSVYCDSALEISQFKMIWNDVWMSIRMHYRPIQKPVQLSLTNWLSWRLCDRLPNSIPFCRRCPLSLIDWIAAIQ